MNHKFSFHVTVNFGREKGKQEVKKILIMGIYAFRSLLWNLTAVSSRIIVRSCSLPYRSVRNFGAQLNDVLTHGSVIW